MSAAINPMAERARASSFISTARTATAAANHMDCFCAAQIIQIANATSGASGITWPPEKKNAGETQSSRAQAQAARLLIPESRATNHRAGTAVAENKAMVAWAPLYPRFDASAGITSSDTPGG